MSLSILRRPLGRAISVAGCAAAVCLSAAAAQASFVPSDPSGTIVVLTDPVPITTFTFASLSSPTFVYNPGPTFGGFFVIDPNAPVVIDPGPVSAVPLPAGAPLLLAGFAGFAALRARKKARAA